MLEVLVILLVIAVAGAMLFNDRSDNGPVIVLVDPPQPRSGGCLANMAMIIVIGLLLAALLSIMVNGGADVSTNF